MVMVKKGKMTKGEQMGRMLASIDTFVVFDIETSGLSPDKGGRIIEIGAVKVEKGKVTDSFSTLIYPEQKVYSTTIKLTGITNEMLAGKPTYEEVLPQFDRWIGDLPVIAHNASFDWNRFMVPFWSTLGIQKANPVICTKVVSNKHLELPDNKLKTLLDYYSVDIESHHRAFDDAEALCRAVFRMTPGLHELYGGEQDNLFEVELPKPESKKANYRIRQVAYWAKEISKKKTLSRIYVTTTNGSVYFDLGKGAWYSKDFKGAADWNEIENRVIDFARLDGKEGLLNFRGKVTH